MSKEKLFIKTDIGESKSKVFKNVGFTSLENKVRFSLKYCNIKKKSFCITLLEKQELKRLYNTLGYFENMSWRQVIQLPHEKGFNIEKKDNQNYKMLKDFCSSFSNFLHFRVNGTDKPFRVFASQSEDLCYILLLDKDGKINH